MHQESQRTLPPVRFAAARMWRLIGHAPRRLMLLVFIGVAAEPAHASQQEHAKYLQRKAGDRFVCGGEIERQSWTLWDRSIRNWVRKSLDDRLRREGDVYVLYDMQTYLHNLAALARRCQRIGRLKEMASALGPAYQSLEAGSWLSPGRRWVCTGGRICKGHAGLLGQEVQLVSVQFLGLTSSIANALATARQPLDEEARIFIRTTSSVIAEHMQRWGNRKAIDRLADAAGASADDVKSGSTGLLFTDKPLWMIGIYAEWAGMLDGGHGQYGRQGKQGEQEKHNEAQPQRPSHDELEAMARHLRVLLKAFNARLTYRTVHHAQGGELKIAELDRGYWRLFRDHRYAGYEGMEKPLLCPDKDKLRTAGAAPNPAPLQRIDAASIPRRPEVGWDLSHGRRLVPVLDALERNRTAVTNVFNLTPKELPPDDLVVRFANALVALSWNADVKQPLFRNYLSGANGWYRVGYATAGNCNEGTPPFGLSESFVTGGYAAWGREQAIIRQLGRRLYQMTAQPGQTDKHGGDFIAQHYPAFSPSSPPMVKSLSNLMFLPSLVGVAGE